MCLRCLQLGTSKPSFYGRPLQSFGMTAKALQDGAAEPPLGGLADPGDSRLRPAASGLFLHRHAQNASRSSVKHGGACAQAQGKLGILKTRNTAGPSAPRCICFPAVLKIPGNDQSNVGAESMRPAAAMNAASKVKETGSHPVVKSDRALPNHVGVARAECDIAQVRRSRDAHACGNTW